jgi:hypothetical protein
LQGRVEKMFKVISHIVLSALLLVSATGMTINMHFCQGHLYDLAFNVPAHDCCENDLDDNACHHDHDMTKAHHCDNESIKIETSHDFLASGFLFDFDNSQSLELFGTSHCMPESPDTEKAGTPRIFEYKKPPPQEVVLSQIQSFLI